MMTGIVPFLTLLGSVTTQNQGKQRWARAQWLTEPNGQMNIADKDKGDWNDQDWFDDNDADIRNLLAEKNGLHKATWTFGLTPPKQPSSDAGAM
ncbi:unnamed protein product [Schistocephalus solidus]|uniref:Inner membrane protein n=1 Tax=Schistocephalus solidus TaxID=70667 RepID=A0A183SXF2_SCHSO|nr:unnamed protein product [Schistocephalus solidus]